MKKPIKELFSEMLPSPRSPISVEEADESMRKLVQSVAPEELAASPLSLADVQEWHARWKAGAEPNKK